MPTEVLPQAAAQFPWHASRKPTPFGGAGMSGGNVISRTAVTMDARRREPESGQADAPGASHHGVAAAHLSRNVSCLSCSITSARDRRCLSSTASPSIHNAGSRLTCCELVIGRSQQPTANTAPACLIASSLAAPPRCMRRRRRQASR